MEGLAHNLKGGSEYEVLVPETLVAENGKPLKTAKSAVIQTKYESMAAASGVYSDAGNLTLTKTETADDGVYFVFTPQDSCFLHDDCFALQRGKRGRKRRFGLRH